MNAVAATPFASDRLANNRWRGGSLRCSPTGLWQWLPLQWLGRGLLQRLAMSVCLALLLATNVKAEIVVVAGPKSSVDKLNKQEVINIFMGRYRVLPDGTPALPLDLPVDSPERRQFYKRLLDKNLDEVNAYWARLIFSGKTAPPEEVKTRDALVNKLTSSGGGVAYLDRRLVPKDFRIIYSLPE